MALNLSDPAAHGIHPSSVVAIRIEGHLIEKSSPEMYDVGLYHHACDDKAFKLFREVLAEDLAVMAFELDWSQAVPCGVCGISLTSPGAD